MVHVFQASQKDRHHPRTIKMACISLGQVRLCSIGKIIQVYVYTLYFSVSFDMKLQYAQ